LHTSKEHTDDRRPTNMGERDRLAQRFVDQELSAEERLQLLARLGHDEPLRTELLSLEHLAFDSARLPRPAVPPGFVDDVLRRTALAASGASGGHQARVSPFLKPRVLHWNLASAMALAAAAVLVVAVAMAGRSARLANDTTATASAPALTPDSPTMFVRLIIMQPDAKACAGGRAISTAGIQHRRRSSGCRATPGPSRFPATRTLRVHVRRRRRSMGGRSIRDRAA
jgi:hypothetical protein